MSETYSALRDYRRRIAAMLDDPECTGDLFALGVSLLDFAVLRINDDEKSWKFYGGRVWGPDAHRWKIRDTLRKDIRRYDAIGDAESNDPARRCGAPMIRRQGPCGQSGSLRTMLTDPDTGRKQWIAACSRHRDWFEARVRGNRLAIEQTEPVTRPAANAGGVLARHIPEINWEKTWLQIDPKWTRPPEAEPKEVPLRPRLTLVLGSDA